LYSHKKDYFNTAGIKMLGQLNLICTAATVQGIARKAEER
jgi:hypothetical protein